MVAVVGVVIIIAVGIVIFIVISRSSLLPCRRQAQIAVVVDVAANCTASPLAVVNVLCCFLPVVVASQFLALPLLLHPFADSGPSLREWVLLGSSRNVSGLRETKLCPCFVTMILAQAIND